MTDKAEGNPAKKPGAEGVELITLANFLESVGPSSPRDVSDLWTYERPGASASIKHARHTASLRQRRLRQSSHVSFQRGLLLLPS